MSSREFSDFLWLYPAMLFSFLPDSIFPSDRREPSKIFCRDFRSIWPHSRSTPVFLVLLTIYYFFRWGWLHMNSRGPFFLASTSPSFPDHLFGWTDWARTSSTNTQWHTLFSCLLQCFFWFVWSCHFVIWATSILRLCLCSCWSTPYRTVGGEIFRLAVAPPILAVLLKFTYK